MAIRTITVGARAILSIILCSFLCMHVCSGGDSEPCVTPKEFPMMENSGSCVDIGGLCQGRQVTIDGTVCDNPDRFRIDFNTRDGRIAMVFDVRINVRANHNTIVMTYKIPGVGWGPENRVAFTKSQFSGGQNYKLAFTVDGETFKITNRGEELASYTLLKDKFSWDEVKSVCIAGCTSKITVKLDNPGYALTTPDPCSVAKEFPLMEERGTCVDIGGLCQGRVVTIDGTVCDKPGRFRIDFKTYDKGLAMVFDVRIKVRINRYKVERNTIVMTYLIPVVGWGPETRVAFTESQFSGGQNYKLAFTVDGDDVKITNRGEALASYTLPKDKFSWSDVKWVCIAGCTSKITVKLDNPGYE